MSIRIMSAVWDSSPYEHSLLLLHLALADAANDEGYCWPAVRTIAKKCRLDERYTRKLLSQMEQDGYLEKSLNEGKKGTNVYLVRSTPVKKDTPGEIDRGVKKTGLSPETPPPLSPRTAEPSVEPSGNNKKAFASLLDSVKILMEALPDEFTGSDEFTDWWAEFFQHRVNLKSKLTPRAVELFAIKFQKWGVDKTIESLQNSVRSGKWTDLYEPKSTPVINSNSQRLNGHSQPKKTPHIPNL